MWKLSALVVLAGCTAGFSAGGSAGPSGPPPPPPHGEGVVVVSSSGGGGGGPTYQGRVPGEWTLQEKEYWKNLHAEYDELADTAKHQCNVTLGADFVHESFRGRLTKGGNYGLDGFVRSACGSAIRTLVEICTAGGMQREAVANRVHGVLCEFGPTRYAIVNGVFHVSINDDTDQHSSFHNGMIDFLKKNL
jgi:hypothetical protein